MQPKEGTMAEKTEAEFSDNDRIAYCECGFFWTVPTGMPWRDCENCDEAPIDLIASYKALAQQDQGTGVGEATRLREALTRLQMGPDTLTQNGLKIVLAALYPEQGGEVAE